MPFIKLVKNKSYFRRYQVKYRRRREGKTDYYARKRLIIQDKNKYNSPKYRLVVRFTNQDVVAQIIYAKITGDVVLAAAYSHELPKYGIKLGLTNYAAAYATGLLLARRVLTKLKLADKYQGETNPSGKHFVVQALEDGPKPFTVLLDVGLTRTSTGNRVFATMKGAADGGLYVPHSTRRLAGYNAQDKKFNADVLRKYIFGGHVAEYMKQLQKEDPESYKRQFSRFVKEKINPDDLEKIYKAAHAAIRKDPAHTKKASKFSGKPKRFNQKKLTQEQRKASLAKRIAALKAAAQ